MVYKIKNIDNEFYANRKSILVKQKRERRVHYYPDLEVHAKHWVPDWEHSKVTRYGFECGYYDDVTVPFFQNMITSVSENSQVIKDLGYCIGSGIVAGNYLDNWDPLVKKVGKEEFISFFKVLIEKGLDKGAIFTDLTPSNLIVKEGIPCLIDLEGLESFSWMFSGKPLPHEAQNRNLQKCDNPFWRGFDEYYSRFMRNVVGIKDYNETLNSVDAIEKMYNEL